MNDPLCERMRTHYPPGTRVQLLRMDDPYAPVPSGTRGTVTHVDDMGQLQMHWDNGQSLALIPEEDVFVSSRRRSWRKNRRYRKRRALR